MEAILSHAMATSRFALGSGEALGVNQADSVAVKAKGSAFNNGYEEKTNTEVGEGSKATELLATSGLVRRGREAHSLRMRCSCSPTCQM